LKSEDATQALVARGWLAGVPVAMQRALFAAGRLQAVPGGAVIGVAGQPGEGLYGIAAGQVSLTSGMNSPDAPLSMLRNPGDWFSYVPLFGQPLVASARAMVDSHLLRVPYPDIRRLLAEQPAWWQHIGQLAFADSMSFATVAVDLMLQAADRRLAAVLLSQAGCRRGGGRPFPINLSQVEIGEVVRLSRNPVRELLQEFESRGWIEQGYRCIHVRDTAALQRLVDGS
jgi:CRP-like cAMP-binding protein